MDETPISNPPHNNHWLSVCLNLLLVGLACVVFWIGKHAIAGDGHVRFDHLSQYLSTGKDRVTKYSMVGPLGSAPFWYLSSKQTSGGRINDFLYWCERYNLLVMLAGLVTLSVCLPREVSWSQRSLFAVLVCFASMYPKHVQEYYGEVFTSMLVAIGLLFLTRGWFIAGCLLASIGVANTPAHLIGIGLASCWLLIRTRQWRFLLLAIIPALFIFAENYIRRGSPFATGYEQDHGFRTVLPYSGKSGFSYPSHLGLMSILFSPGKGLLFFASGLFLPLLIGYRPSTSNESVSDDEVQARPGSSLMLELWYAHLLGLVITYASWWAWYGGWFWGPRLLLFASLPACWQLAHCCEQIHRLSLRGKVVTLCCVLLSVWVAISGYVFDMRGLEIGTADYYAFEYLTWYVPEFSPLWRIFARIDYSTSDINPQWLPFIKSIQPITLDSIDWNYIAFFALGGLRLSVPIIVSIVVDGWRKRSSLFGVPWRW